MTKILIPINSIIKNEKIIQCIQNVSTSGYTEIELFYCSRIEYPIGIDIATYSEVVAATNEHNIEEIEHLKILKSELVKIGYKVKISTREGFFVKEFVDRAKEMGPDLILMFTGGAHNIIEETFGTNTYTIIKELNAPIFVIPIGHEPEKLKTAVVGLSLEDEDYSVVKNYFEFAEKINLKSRFIKIDNNFQLNVFDDELVLKTIHELYPEKIDYIAHRLSEFPSDGLEAYAKEEKADLIVVFTTHRNFIEKIFHKSVTRDLALHSKIPLLVYHY